MTEPDNNNNNKTYICLCLSGEGQFPGAPPPTDESSSSRSTTCYTAWYLIDPTNDTTAITRLAPFYKESPGTPFSTYVALGQKIYQFGGSSVLDWNDIGLDSAKCLHTPLSGSSTTQCDPITRMGSRRVCPAAVVNKGKIYLFGTTSSSVLVPRHWGQVYDPQEGTWGDLRVPPNQSEISGWSVLNEGNGVILFQQHPKGHSLYNFSDNNWTSVSLSKDIYSLSYKMPKQMPVVDGVLYHCNVNGLLAIGLTTSKKKSLQFETIVEGLKHFWNPDEYTITTDSPVLVHLGGNHFSLLFLTKMKPRGIQCVTFWIKMFLKNYSDEVPSFSAIIEHSAIYAAIGNYIENALALDTEKDMKSYLDGLCSSSGDDINNESDEEEALRNGVTLKFEALPRAIKTTVSGLREHLILRQVSRTSEEELMAALVENIYELHRELKPDTRMSLALASAATIAVVTAMVYYWRR